MANFYQYLIDAGINSTASSWGCVIITAIIMIGMVAIICRLLPRRR